MLLGMRKMYGTHRSIMIAVNLGCQVDGAIMITERRWKNGIPLKGGRRT